METLKELLKRAEVKRNIQRQSRQEDLWYDYDPISFYIKMHLDLPSQSYGTRIQNYICSKAGVTTVPSSEDRGDCVNMYGVYHEIKIAYKTWKNDSYNFLQIRPWQEVDYLLVGIDPDNGYEASYYYLTHAQVLVEDVLIGNNCHGTKKANINNKHTSRKLSFKENTSVHRRWIKQYKLDSFKSAVMLLSNSKRKAVVNYGGLTGTKLSYTKQ